MFRMNDAGMRMIGKGKLTAGGLAALVAIVGIALSLPTKAGDGNVRDLVTVDLGSVCPSSISLGGDGFPVRCGSYYSQDYSKGDKRGQRLTMRGPWTFACGSRPPIALPSEISFDVGREGNFINAIGSYPNPCGAGGQLNVSKQQTSAPYGSGINFVFKLYFAG